MNRIYLSAVLAVVCSTSALSADLSSPPPMYAKAAPRTVDPAYNWSGFYGGLSGGYATDPATATFDPLSYANINLQQPTYVDLGGTTRPFGLSAAPKGGFGGVQFGYNWQPAQSPWVLGVEADASFGRLRAEDSKPFFVNAGIFGDEAENSISDKGIARLSQTIDAFGAVRGRLGYAANTLLVYATGGGAWAHTKTRFGVDNVVVLGFGSNATAAQLASLSAGASASSEGYRYGYAAGGGAEWAFARSWSVKAEYVYLNFTKGSSTLVIPGGVAHAGNFDLHTAKGGINYHFN